MKTICNIKATIETIEPEFTCTILDKFILNRTGDFYIPVIINNFVAYPLEIKLTAGFADETHIKDYVSIKFVDSGERQVIIDLSNEETVYCDIRLTVHKLPPETPGTFEIKLIVLGEKVI